MPKVNFDKKEVEINQNLSLNNGDLLIYGDLAFMVSTWGDKCEYCSLIDLSTGARVCPEPCSRRTTRKRICAHMRYRIRGGVKYNRFEHYKKDSYEVNLAIHVNTDSMCNNANYATNVNSITEEVVNDEDCCCPNCGHKI